MPRLDDVPCYPDNPLRVQALFALARGQNSLKASHYADAGCWYRLGAFQENISSMISFADLLRQGIGVKQDFPAARAWLERAANRSSLEAMMELSSMEDLGEGVPVDHAKAETLRATVLRTKADMRRSEREEAAMTYALAEISGALESDPCDIRDTTSDLNRRRELEDQIARGELQCGKSPFIENVQKDAMATMAKQPPDDPIFEKVGRDLMALVGSNQFESIRDKFTPAMKAGKVTPATMRGTWSRMNQKFGAYRGIVASTRLSGNAAVDVLVSFDRGRGNVRFIFDETGAISAIWFQEASPRFWPFDLALKALRDDQP